MNKYTVISPVRIKGQRITEGVVSLSDEDAKGLLLVKAITKAPQAPKKAAPKKAAPKKAAPKE